MVVNVNGTIVEASKEPWLGRMEIDRFDAVRPIELFSLEEPESEDCLVMLYSRGLTFTSNNIETRRVGYSSWTWTSGADEDYTQLGLGKESCKRGGVAL